MIDIIDLGSGNIRSLKNILTRLQVPSRSVFKTSELKSDTVILPGVGSAGPYMEKLTKSGFDKALYEHHHNQGRIIGICLGFHLLTMSSEEDGGTQCLGLIDTVTKKLQFNSEGRMSHTGWEPFSLNKKFLEKANCAAKLGLTRKMNLRGRVFYNHEYGVCLAGRDTNHLEIANPLFNRYASMIVDENIIGIQFHPEKSQVSGLRLFEMML